MLNKIAGLLIVIAIILGIQIVSRSHQTNSGHPEEKNSKTSSPGLPQRVVTVDLHDANNSSESGEAVFKVVGQTVTAEITLQNEPKGAIQPVKIEKGNCEQTNGVLYSLSPLVNGHSKGKLQASPSDMDSAGALALNIYESTASSKQVACGDTTNH